MNQIEAVMAIKGLQRLVGILNKEASLCRGKKIEPFSVHRSGNKFCLQVLEAELKAKESAGRVKGLILSMIMLGKLERRANVAKEVGLVVSVEIASKDLEKQAFIVQALIDGKPFCATTDGKRVELSYREATRMVQRTRKAVMEYVVEEAREATMQ